MTRSITKTSIAREQLEDGITLFLAERYLSSLTLLGSAEEILARILEATIGRHPLESNWDTANRIRSKLGNPHISKIAFFRISNAGRNAVKHHTPGESLLVRHDRFGEAFMMIQRATFCADALKLKYRGKRMYRQWYKSNGWGNPWAKTDKRSG